MYRCPGPQGALTAGRLGHQERLLEDGGRLRAPRDWTLREGAHQCSKLETRENEKVKVNPWRAEK